MEDNKELNKKYEYYINKISENKIQYDNQLKEVFNLKNEIYKLKHTKNALNIDIEELTNKKKDLEDNISISTQLEKEKQLSLHILENRQDSITKEIEDMVTDIEGLKNMQMDLTIKNKQLAERNSKMIDWYNNNKPQIEQMQVFKKNLELVIKNKIKSILADFWKAATISIQLNEKGNYEIANKTLKSAQINANKTIDTNIPDTAKELLKDDINTKTEQTQQFINRRKK